jgi:hypothetical protein
MAEEKRRGRSAEKRPSEDSGGGSRRRSLTVVKLAQRAREQLSEITGLEAEGVTSLQQSDDGTWRVAVELLELTRIPEANDVLGSYDVELDETGALLGYKRVRRYVRSQKDLPQPVGEG